MISTAFPRIRVIALVAIVLGTLLCYYFWTSNKAIPSDQSNPIQSSGALKDMPTFDTSPLPPLKGEQLNDRWVVVTTIQQPTEDVKLLGAMMEHGWRVLAVGDKSTPTDWTPPPGVRFLPASEAEKLGYNFLRFHRWKTYSAKNVGYMFAIHHGAKIIYDTDDDNHPTDALRSMLDLAGVEFSGGSTPKNLTRALYFAPPKLEMPVINPLPHFGQSLLWPRGYPLREISRSPLRSYHLCTTRPPVWIQGVVNGDPDVDAILRMTRKHYNTIINMTFDKAPPVMSPQGYYIQSNSQNTLFVHSALPFIYLPYTVSMRETDIWRGYIGQRLLWLIGLRKGYVSPNAFQFRNPHDYLKDFKDELKVYLNVDDMIKVLDAWQCPAHLDIGACFEDLYKVLYESNHKFVGQDDAFGIAAWVADLRRVGYRFPNRVENPDCIETAAPSTDSKIERSAKIAARLHPVEQSTVIPAHSFLANIVGRYGFISEVVERSSQHNLLTSCRLSLANKEVMSTKSAGFPLKTVTLLLGLSSLTKSEDVVAMIRRLDLIYKPFVARTIYCVPQQFVGDEKCMAAADKYSVSLVETLQFNPSDAHSRSEVAANCFLSAAEMRLSGQVFAYVAADADALITPSGLESVVAMQNYVGEQKQNIMVGACSKDESPLAIAVTAAELPSATRAETLRKACSSPESKQMMTTKACPTKPFNAPNNAAVLSGCMTMNEAASLNVLCSIFAVS